MTATVHCPCCHRSERWNDDEGAVVLVAGGVRRPSEHPTLAAWRTLRRAREAQTGPVVGTCAGCGQPLVAQHAATPPMEAWVLQTPGGDLVVGEEIIGPDGPLDAADVEAWLTARLPRAAGNPPVAVAFAGLTSVGAVVVLVLWILAAIFVALFVLIGIPRGALAPM